MRIEAQQAFDSVTNRVIHPSCIGRASRNRFYFWTDCGQHLVMHTARYVHESFNAAVRCRRCSPPHPLSSHEEFAWKIMQDLLQGSGIIWLVEAPVADPGMRPADIWMPYQRPHPATAGGLIALNLVVQVDGEQHTTYPMYGRSVQQQQRKDEEFNQACRNRNLRVLRLHHADKAEWKLCVRACICTALQCPAIKFVCFTSSYGRGPLIEHVT